MLSACSVIPGSKSASKITTLSGELLSPLEILQMSVERQKEIKSFRSTAYMVTSGFGERLAMTVELEMAQDGRVRMASSMDTPDGEMNFTIITSETDVYMKMPDADWVRMASGAAEGLGGQSVSSFEADFFGSFFSTDEVPWHLFSVTHLGREYVADVETDLLVVQMDLEELWQEESDQMTEFIESVFSEQFIKELMQMELLIWIDAQGYTRRAFMEINVSDMMSVEMDQWMFDFNGNVVISLPQDYS